MSLNNGENLSEPEHLTKEDLDKVVSILMRSFGTTVDSDVIRGVAIFCKGNLTRSIEYLMKQTANQNMPQQPNNEPFNQKKPRNRGPNKLPLKNINIPHDPELGRIINNINKGYNVLVFMRGLPGCGKSTLAQFIFRETVKENVAMHICSSDDYFYINGKYLYDVSKLGDAHIWNQNRVMAYIKQNISPIIVDNTNIEFWEMQIYASAGVASGYMVEVLEPRTPWAFKPVELAKKNTHGVMLHVIKRKLEKYQGGINGSSLLKYLNLRYPPGKVPPKMRLLPVMVTQAHSPMAIDIVAQPSNSKAAPPQDADLIFWESENLKTEPVSPKTDQQAAFLNQPINKIEGFTNFSTASQPIGSSVYDSYEEICKIFAQPSNSSNPTNSPTSSYKLPFDAANNSSVIFNGPVKIATAQNEVIPPPKPQRSFDSKPPRIQNKSSFSDNVDWEPIDVSLSNWDNSNKPIAQSIVHSKSDTQIGSPNRILSSDVSTNTQSFDLNPANWNNFKVLTARNRDINEFYVPILQSLPPKFGLDKGTMIFYDDEMSSIEQSNDDKLDQLRQLRKLFPDVPMEDIRHILSKCKGDVNWAVDLLLDDKTERGAMDVDVPSAVEDDSDLASFENINNFTDESGIKDFTEWMQPMIDYNNISPIQNGIKNVKLQKKDKVVSETSVSLKKQLEENFDFGDNYYSSHVFKLKNKIQKGKYPSKNNDIDNTEEVIEELSNSNERTPSELSDEIEVIEDVVSINMGAEFIDQMDQMFGTNIKQHEKLEPIIHMPISLANQMYALWMESVFNQLDVQREFSKTMIKEDEEFARLVEGLEQEHQSVGKTPEVPNLQEIMDMEMTLAAYKTNMSRWIEETPNTMALKLTRLKLCQLFPDVEKEILLEVLNAYNNDFEQTVQVLLVSLGKISMSDASEMDSTAIQKLLVNQEKDLLERANKEKEKVMMLNAGPECSAMPDDERFSEMDAKSSIAYLRKHAEHHLIIRDKNRQKAQEYFAKGMPQAASYYSQMATLHSKKLEIANNRAAMGIIQATSTDQNDFTLDLHHLFLGEAMQALDLFIDKHISRLIDDPNKSRGKSIDLYLITGRGKHSPGGIPKIKNGTQKRLDERKIKWTKVTDGSLKLTLNSQNMLTDAINMLKNNSGHG